MGLKYLSIVFRFLISMGVLCLDLFEVRGILSRVWNSNEGKDQKRSCSLKMNAED